jgi:hypothetical protein
VLLPLHLGQQPEDDRPPRLILLQVDQQLAEGPRLRAPPERADRVGAVEVGESEDVDRFGASRWREGFDALEEGLLHLLEGHGGKVVLPGDAVTPDAYGR